MQRTAVSTANEVVPIAFVCNKIGMGIPDHLVIAGRSIKTHCPFEDLYHEDGGRSAAFRIYPDSNSAWCFACSEFYSPVKLYGAVHGLDGPTAAEQLLALVGHQGVSVDTRWDAAVAGPQELPNLSTLAEALKTFCARIEPMWGSAQFAPRVAGVLGKCLSLLNMVNTEVDARHWLDMTKKVMQAELRGNI